jgi:hypothetical protein
VRVGADPRGAITQIVEVPADAARVVRADFGFEERLSLQPLPVMRAGSGTPLVAAVRVVDVGPRPERLTCYYRLGASGSFLPQALAKDPVSPGVWLASLPGTDAFKGSVEYYFEAVDADEAEIVSELQRTGGAERESTARVADARN